MSAGCELSSGLVSIELPARLRSDDRIELGDKVVTHDRHVESAGHRIAVVRPKLPRQVPQSTGLVDRIGFSENQVAAFATATLLLWLLTLHDGR
jgi:hypothetical protein